MKKWIIILCFIVSCYTLSIDDCTAEISIATKDEFIPKTKIVNYDNNIQPFSFVVISDSHTSEPVREGYEKFGTAKEKFQKALEEIAKMKNTYDPEFILITGDLHLWAIKDVLKNLKLPVHVIAGNHEKIEDKKELRQFFSNDFQVNGRESDYYSFLHKGVRFIGICDATYPDHVGHLSSESIQPFGQSEWLEAELKKTEKIKVIFGHIPPEPNAIDKDMWLSRNDSFFFNELVKRTKPSLMFFGHQHRAKKFMISGCNLYIVRSLSWNENNFPIGFLLVNLQNDGVLIKEILLK